MAGMEKDLFGESSAEDDSSDDDFPKPSGRGKLSKSATAESGTPSSSSSSEEDDEEEEESGKEDDGSQEGESESGDGDTRDEPTANESQFPSTQDLFGMQSSSDSSDSEGEGKGDQDKATPTTAPALEDEQTKIAKGLFGEEPDTSSSDDDNDLNASIFRARQEGMESQEGVSSEPSEELPRIDVEIPRCVAKLGTDQYFVKLPNFLSIETRPFDPSLYEDEVEDEGEFLDEDGRARLKLKVENTIRWRKKVNSQGVEERESNARVVQWTDGSMSLYLGSEIFDIHKQPLQGEFSHLFVRQGTGLQGQAVFKNKLTFRPHSTDSHTHRKMTLSIADRFSKAQKIRVLPVVDKNPESRRSEMIKEEEQRLRESMRYESQQRRKKEKEASKELSASYIEPRGRGGVATGAGYGLDYEDEDEEGVSIAAIKTSVKSSRRSRKDSFIDDDSEGLEMEDDNEEEEEEEEEEEMEFDEEEQLTKSSESQRGQRKRPSQEAAPAVKAKGRKLLFSDDDEDYESD